MKIYDVDVTAYPLFWPVGRPRTPRGKQERARFNAGHASRRLTVRIAIDRVLLELGRLGCGDYSVVASTNIPTKGNGLPYSDMPEPEDRGVAVYFRIKDEPHCLSCDRWDRVADNLAAIAAHVEAVRGQLRWGVADLRQVFAGFKALPAAGAKRPWWEVLAYKERPTNVAQVLAQHRRLAIKHHPDVGGTVSQMAEINAARDEGLAELDKT